MIVISGCMGTSKPARFYLLNSMERPADASTTEAMDMQISISLGPILLPEYLNRSQIVIRTPGSEIKVDEFNRWAEPLKENFSQVLAQNLVVLLNTDTVWLFPWSDRIKVDYQVSVKVDRFDAIAGRHAELRARWTIFSVQERSFLRNGRAAIKKELQSNDFEAIVAAHNALLQDLSKQIAEDIKKLYMAQ